MDNIKDVRKPLRKKILLECTVFIVFLTILLGLLGGVFYFRGMVNKYQAYIRGILLYAESEIDAEDMKTCIETGEKSETYSYVQDGLDKIKEAYEIDYIYIVKPLNTEPVDNMMDIVAGATEYEKENEQDTLTQLGHLTGDAYSPDVAAIYLKAMDNAKGEISYFRNRTEFGYDYTGVIPIKDDSGNSVCVLAVDISVNDIIRMLINYITILLIGMVILVAIFLYGMYKTMNKQIVSPIIRLKESASGFVESSRGQSDPDKIEFKNPDIRSEDEMQLLSESLMHMAGDIKAYMKNLMKETKEKERIGTELALATQIQEDMLPNLFPAFPERDEFDIYATMTPAKEVGGDFYDFFLIDEDHLGLVMADVSGKGVPAALFMMMSKILVNNYAMMNPSPAETLMGVNNQVCKNNRNDMFVTVWLGILTISTGHVVATNAGHEYPVIKSADGKYELFKDKHRLPIGSMEGTKYIDYEFDLEKGGGLFIYTDGVAEATNAENELFGTDRMLDALNVNPDADATELLGNVRRAVDEFVGDAPQFDDLTMLGFKYYGKK